MNTDSRETIREQYGLSGEQYDAARTKTARGFLLRTHEVGLFRRMLPAYREGMQVLEVGAGTGDFTMPMLESGYRLIASDINESMLAVLRRDLDEAGLGDRCEVRVEDVFNLSFPDDTFDLIYSVHVIPRFLNTDDQRAALTEIARVNKPGGMLIFNYRNAGSPYNLVTREHATKRSDVAKILADAGMRIDQTRTKHLLNRTLMNRIPVVCCRALSAIDRATERLLPSVAWDVYVAAVKQS